jgi:hypothetical protein
MVYSNIWSPYLVKVRMSVAILSHISGNDNAEHTPRLPVIISIYIHQDPIGYANWYCVNPLNYLNLSVLRVGITWQRCYQNIYVSNVFVSIKKTTYFENIIVKPSFLFGLK